MIKVLCKYVDQSGFVAYGTSVKVITSFFNKRKETTVALFCGNISITENRLKEIREGLDPDYEYLQNGVYAPVKGAIGL